MTEWEIATLKQLKEPNPRLDKVSATTPESAMRLWLREQHQLLKDKIRHESRRMYIRSTLRTKEWMSYVITYIRGAPDDDWKIQRSWGVSARSAITKEREENV